MTGLQAGLISIPILFSFAITRDWKAKTYTILASEMLVIFIEIFLENYVFLAQILLLPGTLSFLLEGMLRTAMLKL